MKTLFLIMSIFFASVSLGASPITPYSEKKFTSLADSGKDFVVYFYATWCPKCRKQKNIIDKYLKSKKTVNPILLADYDTEVELRKKFKIFVQGTMLNFKAGKEVKKDRLIAEVDPNIVKAFIDKVSKP